MKTATTLTLFVILSILASACGTTKDGFPSNSAVVDVVANASLTTWLTSAIASFNKAGLKTASGRPVNARVSFVEAGQAVATLSSSDSLPALWIPDDEVWASVLAKRGKPDFQGNCQSVAQSPLVIAMWRPIAEDLGWPGRALGWLDVGTLAADPSSWAYYSGGAYGDTLRMGHSHPGLSSSGAETLLAIVQAARSKTDAVSADDIKEPIVQASVGAFESTVALFSPSTEKLGQTLHERGASFLAAAVVYESTVVNAGGGGADGLVAIYPFEGTFMARHPACINGSSDAAIKEGAGILRDYLLKPEQQKAALANGLRPVTPGVAIGAPLDADHGVDPTQPKVIYNSPSVDTIVAVGDLWQSVRKSVNLVMLVDTSGSMRGDKIDNVRTAAEQFVKQMGDADYLTLITFASNPVVVFKHQKVSIVRDSAIQKIGDIQAGGNTSLYDSIGLAAGLIKESNSSQTSNAMVVLTDGQDTSSNSWEFNQTLITAAAANNTAVFTIAYGEDADKDVMTQLASQGKGSFYLGTEANISDIYQELSVAFGGSAGIGR